MLCRDKIEFVLTYTEEIKIAIERTRKDPNIPKTGGGGHCRVSDPTAAIAIRNADALAGAWVYYGPIINGEQQKKWLEYPESWLDVANATRRYYGNSMQRTILERHFHFPQDLRKDICHDLRIGTTYYNMMLKEIFCFAYGYSMGKGLIFYQKR